VSLGFERLAGTLAPPNQDTSSATPALLSAPLGVVSTFPQLEKFTAMSKEFIIKSGTGILPVCFKTGFELWATHRREARATIYSQP
jgi:hypothetical protein